MEPLTTEQEYQQMRTMLNEQQWRQRLSAEAQRRGSASTVAREAGVSLNTVKRGLKERGAGQIYQPGARIRQAGAGRKKVAESDPTLLADLEQALEPKGDPMSLVRWTTKSLAHLVQALEAQRASHQEVSPGRTAPRAGVFAACQQEDDRGNLASGSGCAVCAHQRHLPGV